MVLRAILVFELFKTPHACAVESWVGGEVCPRTFLDSGACAPCFIGLPPQVEGAGSARRCQQHAIVR